MILNLMYNDSPANYVDKDVTLKYEYTGTLRMPSDIINPTILIEHGVSADFNYFYIPDFARYYFLTDITVVSDTLTTISGHVDVLYTYRERIRSWSGIVSRQENLYNLYLDDAIFKAENRNKHKVLTFPNSFDKFSYILTLAGGNTT